MTINREILSRAIYEVEIESHEDWNKMSDGDWIKQSYRETAKAYANRYDEIGSGTNGSVSGGGENTGLDGEPGGGG